ncbi:hypothetical protein BKA80DRAFT_284681, partial [Phyllosticta citrichinensis]
MRSGCAAAADDGPTIALSALTIDRMSVPHLSKLVSPSAYSSAASWSSHACPRVPGAGPSRCLPGKPLYEASHMPATGHVACSGDAGGFLPPYQSQDFKSEDLLWVEPKLHYRNFALFCRFMLSALLFYFTLVCILGLLALPFPILLRELSGGR